MNNFKRPILHIGDKLKDNLKCRKHRKPVTVIDINGDIVYLRDAIGTVRKIKRTRIFTDDKKRSYGYSVIEHAKPNKCDDI